MDSACFTYEGLPVSLYQIPCKYIPPVWILGKRYDDNPEEINEAVRSRIWLTYRKGFAAIGGTGPTTDHGWGCMLRCGQMILAEALIRRHLGRDWIWGPSEKNIKYMMILKTFMDRKDSFYSIHQIAQMGASEGKAIGSWFGPNTVAQAIRKLAQFDEWSNLVIHVAMDNTVVVNDIRCLCKENSDDVKLSKCGDSSSPVHNHHYKEQSCSTSKLWKPLLLFIPLRLGLTNVNDVYKTPLKKCFTITQSIGCIGGKPNHAAYFIGYHGNKLLYLDPHVTQQIVEVERYSEIPDQTYHCHITPPLSMNFSNIDPSLALGFYCDTEAEFEELCVQLEEITKSSTHRMFEIVQVRPPHWPPYQPPSNPHVDPCNFEFESLQPEIPDIEEGYEII